MLPEIADTRPRGQVMRDGIGGGLRQQDLAAPPHRGDAGGAVDLQADISTACHDGLARVQSHPYAQYDTVGPGRCGQGTLRRQRGPHRTRSAREDDKQTLARRVLLIASGPVKDLPQKAVIGFDDRRVAIPKLMEEVRRVLDVGEEECKRSAWRI